MNILAQNIPGILILVMLLVLLVSPLAAVPPLLQKALLLLRRVYLSMAALQRLAGHRTLIDQGFVAFFTQQKALIVGGIVYMNDRRLTRHQHQRLFLSDATKSCHLVTIVWVLQACWAG